MKMSLRFRKILNPQENIPNIQSKYTVINNDIKDIDLNEGLWAKEVAILIFLFYTAKGTLFSVFCCFLSNWTS